MSSEMVSHPSSSIPTKPLAARDHERPPAPAVAPIGAEMELLLLPARPPVPAKSALSRLPPRRIDNALAEADRPQFRRRAVDGAGACALQTEERDDCVRKGYTINWPGNGLLRVWRRYYTLSVILGTVALSYGSVPLYKMVRKPCSACHQL